jgi:DNA polymerase-1
LVEVDYGGIEVRVAACYHKDPTMLEYIHDPSKDMHRDMAMQCFCLLDTEITKELRFDAKSFFVFAQFYGDYYGNCAPKLWDSIADKKTAAGVSVRKILLQRKKIKFLGDTECPKGSFMAHIKAIQDDFWGTRFPIYGRWRREWVKSYEKSGELKLLTGFVCRGLKRKNEIINYPIQGSAFHCLLWCLIRIVLVELKKRKLKSLIVGQIHDSLVGDVLETETEDFEALVREIMTEVLPAEWSWIIVPLTIEITRYSHSWAEGD